MPAARLALPDVANQFSPPFARVSDSAFAVATTVPLALRISTTVVGAA